MLRRIRARLGNDRTVALGSIGTALAIVLFGLAGTPATALAASLIAGASWVRALATLNLSAQMSLPDWVRGRGLAIYIMVFFGAMSVGSALWGQLAAWIGLLDALWIAAATMLLAIALTWRWNLQHSTAVDLSPSRHWPVPQALQLHDAGDGPVMVTVEYQVTRENQPAFLLAVRTIYRYAMRAYCNFISPVTCGSRREIEAQCALRMIVPEPAAAFIGRQATTQHERNRK